MNILGSCINLLIFHLISIEAIGVGQAWRVSPYSKTDYSLEHPSWPRLDSSAFEVRTVSGVGRFVPFNDLRNFHNDQIIEKIDNIEPNSLIEQENIERDSREMSQFEDIVTKKSKNVRKDLSFDQKMTEDTVTTYPQKIFRTKVSMRVFPIDNWDKSLNINEKLDKIKETNNHRVRRETENDTNMERIGTMLTLREARLASPETWSKQPLSVEFRHRSNFEQPSSIRDSNNDEDDTSIGIRNYQSPRADFVTSHYHRRVYPDNRESRDTFVSKTFDDIDLPWYRNMIRERDYDLPSIPRRSYSEYYRNYPERNYRMERDYYMRIPNNEHSYYYDRYRDEDLDLYGRSRPTPKPKRIIYYATLPEIVRKPVDLRNYPKTPYDGGLTRTTVTRGGTFERVPGNVDPSRDDEDRRKGSIKENLNDHDSGFEASNDRNVVNQIQNRDDGNKLPWPVQIGTEVSVKDDDRIHGRKIFGDTIGFERLQNSPEHTSTNETTEKNIN
ncbi:PREDICTED: uncharacterized protein LOC107066074 isoform X2 [Polistes dominula]|uniref:Uncharacterized protein LOC107066074 isoform X2 n=1 Tax=Polistes dominula TaxID=743375 RepID=A0ABM1I6I1_POLDO|nr:PREDICTED: uncharacterized protein LOC107066074 isoform X2 [Polistes dominula]